MTNPPSSPERRRRIANLLISNTLEIPLDPMAKDLAAETYADIEGNDLFRDTLRIRNKGIPLNALKGINANQITLFNPGLPDGEDDVPEIRQVLKVAMRNLVLAIAGRA